MAWSVAIAALCATGLSALAQSGSGTSALPISTTLGAENVHLPGHERMGLVGGSVLFGVADDWWLGPAVYGAATGERGGLFVGGIELQRRWRIADRWWLTTGAYAGGGGGASAPVGGGLMWRPALAVFRDLGPMAAGLSWSQVRFSSGLINSTQIGLLLAWRTEFRHHDLARIGTSISDSQRTGLGFDQLAGTVGTYQLSGDRSGRIGLIGARAERLDMATGWRWGIESGAAAQGGAAGYMEILASLGHDWALGKHGASSPRLGLRSAVGLGGGGAIPTGGGGLVKLAATIAWPLQRGWQVGAELGTVRATDANLRARSTQVWLAMDLEPRATDGALATPSTVARYEWAATLQRYQHAQRRDGSSPPLDTIGLKLNRYLGESLYLSAQAHSAYAGGAGAYSVGLVGLGLATRVGSPGWQAGAEALVGAAGGGGVATTGGAIVQALVWAGWGAPDLGQWRAGVGAVRSRNQELRSPLIELTWSRAFGLNGP